jgi:4-diphosphocytidyl-2-C-methyl-D-erythritol kinase
MRLKSFAKINLTLDILGKTEKSYHKLQTIYQRISLFDTLEFTLLESDEIQIESNDQSISNERNLAFKAAKIMQQRFSRNSKTPRGIKIFIEKRIPVAAGLGGGSSNAACTINALNTLWKLNLSNLELEQIAWKIGVDTNFFLQNFSTALGHNFGEKVDPLPVLNTYNLIVVSSLKPCETANAYQLLDLEKCGKHLDESRLLISEIMNKKGLIYGHISNDFETLLEDERFKQRIEIIKIKEDLMNLSAQAVCLCGSGSAVFGIFADHLSALRCQITLEKKYPFVWRGKTC